MTQWTAATVLAIALASAAGFVVGNLVLHLMGEPSVFSPRPR